MPLALAGDDLIGQARTGMGKTYAFGVPMLQRITTDPDRELSGIPRALVVVPTRELCIQVSGDLATAPKSPPMSVTASRNDPRWSHGAFSRVTSPPVIAS